MRIFARNNNRMKIVFFLIFNFISISLLQAQEFPEPMNPPRLVNDFAGLLNSNQNKMLEDKLRNYYDTTSTQIAIVTLKSIGGADAGQYAPELAERWGIGQAGKDNGLVILVALQEREIRIATGYGLEPTVTDAASRRIIENYIKPNFRRENYFEGLDQSTSIIMSLAAGEFEADKLRGSEGESVAPVFLIFLVLFFLVILPLMRHRAAKKAHFGKKPLDFFTTMMLMNAMRGKRGGGFGDFKGGRGGFGGFGGGGGGGFGGFGGGSFGGGGAGGSW
jgi:uncharacterized protein